MSNDNTKKKEYIRPSFYINREDEIELVNYITNNGGMKELLFLAAQSYYKPLVEINKQSSKKKILEAGLKSLNNLRSQMLEILFALKIQDIELDIVVLTALGFSQIAIDRCNSSEQSKIATISSRGFVSLDDEKENWDVLQTTPNGDRFEDAGSWNTAAPDVDESILMQEKHG